MYLNNNYIIVFLLISLSCSDQKGWGNEGVGDTFSIKRQKSYNYSEMLSGDLDSINKTKFDNYKQEIAEKKGNELDNENTNVIKKEKKFIKKNITLFCQDCIIYMKILLDCLNNIFTVMSVPLLIPNTI